MPELPIHSALPDLLEAVTKHPHTLLVAQPGAGKTTVVPLALLQAFPSEGGRWLLLEPRRIAARMAAAYMAEQLGERPGQRVGYRVRGDSRCGPDTRLEVITEGILIRLLQDDPTLPGIQGIIFDEFHERSLEADLGLSLCLDSQAALRPDLRLLIMSATLDTQALLTVLGDDCQVIECSGRQFPVSTHYRPISTRQEPSAQQASVVLEALDSEAGDILCFLPGQREIRALQRRLVSTLPDSVEVMPLHGQLSLAAQRQALRPAGGNGKRRVILSTAIAESSLTVNGVRIVIDAGYERVPAFQARTGLSRLVTRRVNRASADQRRGRAGREAAGVCYRLWPEELRLVDHREPEISQGDLSGLLFELARWGVSDPDTLPWVSPPPPKAIAAARQLLQMLSLLDNKGRLSASGQQAARWPAHPRVARLLEQAHVMNCLPLACWLAAWLEEQPQTEGLDMEDCLAQRPGSDHQGVLARWRQLAQKWAQRCNCNLEIDDLQTLGALLACAFPDRLAQQQAKSTVYRLRSGGQAQLPPSEALSQQPYIIALELDGDPSAARVYRAASISLDTLLSLFGDQAPWQTVVYWDSQTERVVAEEQRRLDSLILARRPSATVSTEATRTLLLQQIRQRGSLAWSTADRQLLGRLRLLRRSLGAPWPDMEEARLMAALESWLSPGLDGLTRLAQVDALPLGKLLLDSLLDWSLRQSLDQLAPDSIKVPSGERIRIDYSGEEPVLAVKLQAIFGMSETPYIADGRVPLLIHLLSPAGRPVQVTRDLGNFWASTYFDVRRDLRGRYPKHPWPDDPLTAIATSRARRPGRRPTSG